MALPSPHASCGGALAGDRLVAATCRIQLPNRSPDKDVRKFSYIEPHGNNGSRSASVLFHFGNTLRIAFRIIGAVIGAAFVSYLRGIDRLLSDGNTVAEAPVSAGAPIVF